MRRDACFAVMMRMIASQAQRLPRDDLVAIPLAQPSRALKYEMLTCAIKRYSASLRLVPIFGWGAFDPCNVKVRAFYYFTNAALSLPNFLLPSAMLGTFQAATCSGRSRSVHRRVSEPTIRVANSRTIFTTCCKVSSLVLLTEIIFSPISMPKACSLDFDQLH